MKRFALGAVGCALLWGEYENWRASRQLVRFVPGATEAVVVLGSKNAGTEANALNRWRVRAGIRSQDARAARSCLILSGGAVGSDVSEAALMARYARSRGVQDLLLEERSRSTWENIENIIPLVEGFDRLKIVSNPLHALKARTYLAQQRPELAARLAPGAEYRFGEWMPLKFVFAVFGLLKMRGYRTKAAGPDGLSIGHVSRR